MTDAFESAYPDVKMPGHFYTRLVADFKHEGAEKARVLVWRITNRESSSWTTT